MVTEQVLELEAQPIAAPASVSAAGAAAFATATERAERRNYKRYPFTATLEAVELKSQTRIHGRTSDLSLGGCYVDAISPFPVDTIVKVRIVNSNRAFETHARVAYSLQGMGMGLEFGPPEADQALILEKWVKQLSGEIPVEPEEPEPAQTAENAPASDEAYYILNELIIELMRSKVLPAERCKGMLQRLHGAKQAA